MLRRLRFALVVLIAGVLLAAVLVPDGDPTTTRLDQTFAAIGSPGHPLGTDHLGRDLMARLTGGLVRTCWVAVIATGLSVSLGVMLGLLSGYLGRWVRALVMMITDLVMIVPEFIAALIFAALFGLTPVGAGVVLGLFGIGPYVNQTDALTRSVKSSQYLEVETLMGTGTPTILTRHVFPAVLPAVSAYAGASAASSVLAYAGLAFVGLGVDTTQPDWGTMLYEYRVFLLDHPMLMLAPTVGILRWVSPWKRDTGSASLAPPGRARP